MKELMPRIIASGRVANVIQLIKHAIKSPRRSDADQVTLQGKLNERSQRILLGLLKFLKEQHFDVPRYRQPRWVCIPVYRQDRIEKHTFGCSGTGNTQPVAVGTTFTL